MEADIGYLDYQADPSLYIPNPLDGDEGPVIVSWPFEFKYGRPQSIPVGKTAVCPITLENTSAELIDRRSIKIYDAKPKGAFTLSWIKPPSTVSDDDSSDEYDASDRYLLPYHTITLWLSCTPQDLGQHTAVILVDYEQYNVRRVAILMAEDDLSLSLDSLASGVRPSIEPFAFGIRLPRILRQPTYDKKKISEYMIPNDIRELLQENKVPQVLQQGLGRKTYAQFFTSLLIMEEIYLEGKMKCYDAECVTLTTTKRGITLKIPVPAERRPSFVYGDMVFATPLSVAPDEEALTYQGNIFHVRSNEVYVHFSGYSEPHINKDCPYTVRFSYNRGYVRRLYKAIELAQTVRPNILFPSDINRKRMARVAPFKPIVCKLDEEQMQAVRTILASRGSPPYVLHGPPGTGKTLTLVEAVLQLYTGRKDTRVLICAASNSAADHILDWLLGNNVVQFHENEIYRLSVDHRFFDDGTSDIFRFGNIDESVMERAEASHLRQCRVIISTYPSASCFQARGIFKRGNFSHIFLDDASQASEPESMLPISSLCSAHTVIVIAGDHMQLGPVVYSRDADSLGLGKSYLERLLEAESYCGGNEMHVMKLVRNYRSHPSILDLPSKLFYNGEVVSCKDNTQFTCDLDTLPNKEFPVLFYGVQGCDEWEGTYPSWFNRFEVSKVIEIIEDLANYKVEMREIGVITPYRLQATKISKVLRVKEMRHVKVGCVEQFQGQEREVIIVSAVRSTSKHIEFDEKFRLGLINNPKRFNVAMTRAKSLLIIVANPHIVCKDTNWNQLLWYCVDNKSYQGCPLPNRPKPMKISLPQISDTKCGASPEEEEEEEEGNTSSEGEILANDDDLEFLYFPAKEEYADDWFNW